MRILGNILWHIPFMGFVNAILVYLLGLLLTITIVAAPLGLGLMEYGKFLFAPFSWSMVDKDDLDVNQNALWKVYSTIIMILYIPFGILGFLFALCQIIALVFSIFGIPVAIVVAKSLGTYFNPVNKVCVSRFVAEDVQRKKALERR